MLRTEIYIPARRRDVVFLVILLLFSLLLGRFYYLQIYRHEQYSLLADANRIRMVTQPAPRGNILDRKGEILAANQSIYAISVIKDELIDEDVQMDMMERYLDRDKRDLQQNLKKYYQGRFLPALIARNVSIAKLSLIEEHNNELPGVFSTKLPVRFYPNVKNVRASHILGYLREINNSELNAMKEGDYVLGDYLGFQGLEKLYENRLRGVKGAEFRQVDALGREVGIIIDREPIASIPGENLHLTIDAGLQSRTESLLEGKRAAAVIINAETGELLAMVSKPDFLLRDFSAGMDIDKWRSYSTDESRPLFNRAVLGLYPPGSSFKLITTIAALEQGLVDDKWSVQCTGSYEFGDRTFGCWREDGHGSVNLSRAIVESCNVYFYQLVQRMDIDTWAAYVKLFGFGSLTGIDVPDENDGVVADRAYMNKKYGRWGWAEGSLLHLAIGQGDILVTPLQMAQFIGIVAMKGDQYRPKLVKNETKDRMVRIPIKSATWRTIHKMTFDVVNKRGGTAFDKELAASDISVHGKTGTAENPHGDPHAWFVGFVEGKGETIAISLIIENGGTGGSTAAPIASKLIKSYFRVGDATLAADL